MRSEDAQVAGPAVSGASGGFAVPGRGVRGLIGDAELEHSPVVANNTMNRGRGLAGVNGYDRELSFDVLGVLRRRLVETGRAAWLDLCCGEGRAVIEGAAVLAGPAARLAADASRISHLEETRAVGASPPSDGQAGLVSVIGVDLVEAFALPSALPPGLRLVAASVARWRPEPGQAFDLITCVHGLHYVGDKLGLLTRAAAWTAPGGVFAATFDPAGVRHESDRRSASRRVVRALRDAGAVYDARRHLVSWEGPIALDFGARYTGADAAAGPGYTGMDAVDSCYVWS